MYPHYQQKLVYFSRFIYIYVYSMKLYTSHGNRVGWPGYRKPDQTKTFFGSKMDWNSNISSKGTGDCTSKNATRGESEEKSSQGEEGTNKKLPAVDWWLERNASMDAEHWHIVAVIAGDGMWLLEKRCDCRWCDVIAGEAVWLPVMRCDCWRSGAITGDGVWFAGEVVWLPVMRCDC